MKATEIQIGDAVIDSYGRVIHVSSINEHNITYNYFDSGYYGEKCTKKELLTDISPIPLTPEILNKNGFVCNCFDRWTNNRYDVAIAVKDEFMFIWERIQLNYVHELQHALRLCGLDDLADNFKV